ncbi:TcpQ domain-containing protein [Achromobacter piechaudii]|uniref:TcpQ domain-containing protein n=1 Tax=Achromobacter piechaudii TaxID=72556 RepID=UPI000680D8C4|nr:TcpQ domain-containing protein [Achromobacter piechaudii]
MVRIFFFFLAAGVSCLGACTGWPPNNGAGPAWQAAGSGAREFRFDWRLSGDTAVAPIQVFDDGQDVWLQFAPGQPLPAIFGMRENVEHALPYVRREPYAVVAGAWSALRFRGGRLTARAERDTSAAAAVSGSAVSAASAPLDAQAALEGSPLSSVGELAGGGPLGARDTADQGRVAGVGMAGASATGGVTSEPRVVTASALDGASSGASPTGASISSATASGAGHIATRARYRAAPPDTTLRAVLARWADDSGWTFRPQHWAVDVDIPLSASAEFSGDFKSAVRELLSATELADKPLQPCFYGNQVLRVVPLAQSCSRAAFGHGGGA